MNENSVNQALFGSGLAAWRYLESTDSTNSEAARWLEAGASDRSLVLADHQVAGRGRMGRIWYTAPGTALTMSLILKAAIPTLGRESPSVDAREPDRAVQLLTGLGAVALSEVLEVQYGLPVRIKWPNDVLVDEKKIAGILVEAYWTGEQLDGAVIGIGVNILKGSVPSIDALLFPATSLEACLQAGSPDRLLVLRGLVETLLGWLPRIESVEFLFAWESRLAWRGQRVQVLRMADQPINESMPLFVGRLSGLDESGRLRLLDDEGKTLLVEAGDLRLRPAG